MTGVLRVATPTSVSNQIGDLGARYLEEGAPSNGDQKDGNGRRASGRNQRQSEPNGASIGKREAASALKAELEGTVEKVAAQQKDSGANKIDKSPESDLNPIQTATRASVSATQEGANSIAEQETTPAEKLTETIENAVPDNLVVASTQGGATEEQVQRAEEQNYEPVATIETSAGERTLFAPIDSQDREEAFRKVGAREADFAGDPAYFGLDDNSTESLQEEYTNLFTGGALAPGRNAASNSETEGAHAGPGGSSAPALATSSSGTGGSVPNVKIPDFGTLETLAGVFDQIRPNQAAQGSKARDQSVEQLTDISRRILGVPRDQAQENINQAQLPLAQADTTGKLKANLGSLISNALNDKDPAEDLPILQSIAQDPDAQATLKSVLSSNDQAGFYFAGALSQAINTLADDDQELQNGLIQLASAVFPDDIELRFLVGNTYITSSDPDAGLGFATSRAWLDIARSLAKADDSELDYTSKAFEGYTKDELQNLAQSFQDFLRSLDSFGASELIEDMNPLLGAKVSKIKEDAWEQISAGVTSLSRSTAYQGAKGSSIRGQKAKLSELKKALRKKSEDRQKEYEMILSLVEDNVFSKLWQSIDSKTYQDVRRSVGALYFAQQSEGVWWRSGSELQRAIEKTYKLANAYLRIEEAEKIQKIVEDDIQIRELLKDENLEIPPIKFTGLSI